MSAEPTQNDYVVIWEINLTAQSPRHAAMQAFEIVQEPKTTATVFDVFNEQGDMVRVDLLEDEE